MVNKAATIDFRKLTMVKHTLERQFPYKEKCVNCIKTFPLFITETSVWCCRTMACKISPRLTILKR